VAEVAPTAAVVVVGGDAIVGRALELLLRGSGYDARFEAPPTFDARGVLREAGLVLLAPGLDERDRGAVLSSVEAACHEGDLPVLELVSATAPLVTPAEPLMPCSAMALPPAARRASLWPW